MKRLSTLKSDPIPFRKFDVVKLKGQEKKPISDGL